MTVRTVRILTGWTTDEILAERVVIQDDELGQLYEAQRRMALRYPTVRLYAAPCAGDSAPIYAADLDHLLRTAGAVVGQSFEVAHAILTHRIEGRLLGHDGRAPAPKTCPRRPR